MNELVNIHVVDYLYLRPISLMELIKLKHIQKEQKQYFKNNFLTFKIISDCFYTFQYVSNYLFKNKKIHKKNIPESFKSNFKFYDFQLETNGEIFLQKKWL